MIAEHLTRYIVSQKLAGNEEFFCIVGHAIRGYSPSEIAEICNVSKNSTRSYLCRLSEKGSMTRALVVARYVVPIVLITVPTAVVTRDGMPFCTLCKKHIGEIPQFHTSTSHKDVVKHYTDIVLSKLREAVLNTSE
jgi:hypothetical protein